MTVTRKVNQAKCEDKHSLKFRVRRYVVTATKPRAPIANPPNSEQLWGHPYRSSSLHLGPCSSVGMRPRTDRQTDTQTAVTTCECNYFVRWGQNLLTERETSPVVKAYVHGIGRKHPSVKSTIESYMSTVGVGHPSSSEL